ncbi:MAG TPA: rhodanese-like domain-containing protein [Bacteroidota bacterium]|nr:rhodanese-like domain-containing protein [Bacteroidota bacterium]
MSIHALHLRRYLVTFLVALPLLVLTNACSDDDDGTPITPAVNEAQLLVQELESTNGDYLNTAAPAIVTAQNVYEDINGAKKMYLVDVRAAADYALGHVAGAVNVPIANILTHMKGVNLANYDKVVIICYTGQSAAWTTAILRMAGYAKAFSMKFGMSSWHADFDRISSKVGSQYSAQFVKTASPAKPAVGNLPTISTSKTTGAEILAARVETILAEGYSKSSVEASAVFATPDQFYVVNYWPEADYLGVGHIPGSLQYTPKADLKLATFLKTLPTNKTVVIYCYTGQTSANVAAILRVMGYDAKSLSFGTNGMIWDLMKAAGKTRYEAGTDCMNFEYVK